MNKRKFSLCSFVLSLLILALSVSVVAANGVWNQVEDQIELYRVSMVSADNGWAIAEPDCNGNSAAIELYRWNGTSWTLGQTLNITGDRVCFAAIAMVSANDGWLTLPRGLNAEVTEVYRWNGSQWMWSTSLSSSSSNGIRAIDVNGPNDVWAVSSAATQPTYFHWNGMEWIRTYGPGGIYAGGAIDVLNVTDGWSVGSWGAIARLTVNGWQPFTKQSVPDGPHLNDIEMVSPNDGWIVGENGTIKRWQGGNWVDFPSPTDQDLHAVEMLSATSGYAVGYGGIYEWDGSSWSSISGSGSFYTDLDLVDANNGWAVGRSLAQLSGETADDGDDMPPADNDDCVIPPSGPWPPCATGGDASPSDDCVIPPSGPWPPCATGGTPPTDLPAGCVVPSSGPWPSCARVRLVR